MEKNTTTTQKHTLISYTYIRMLNQSKSNELTVYSATGLLVSLARLTNLIRHQYKWSWTKTNRMWNVVSKQITGTAQKIANAHVQHKQQQYKKIPLILCVPNNHRTSLLLLLFADILKFAFHSHGGFVWLTLNLSKCDKL